MESEDLEDGHNKFLLKVINGESFLVFWFIFCGFFFNFGDEVVWGIGKLEMVGAEKKLERVREKLQPKKFTQKKLQLNNGSFLLQKNRIKTKRLVSYSIVRAVKNYGYQIVYQ